MPLISGTRNVKNIISTSFLIAGALASGTTDMKNDISTFLFNWPGDTRFRYYRYKKMLFQLFNWPGDIGFRYHRYEKYYFNLFL